jgi:hypothetical protein
MKKNTLIIAASILAVVICLILAALLLFSVKPESLLILAFTIGIITGICILALIISLRNKIWIKRQKESQKRGLL